MSDKLITIEAQDGPFQVLFQRIMRMVPDRDKDDKNLQRLLAFRLRTDGEAALSEYLIRKIRETIKCAYTGSLYNFLKGIEYGMDSILIFSGETGLTGLFGYKGLQPHGISP